jgi:hypothetical protein
MKERRATFGYDCKLCKRACHLCNYTSYSSDPVVFNLNFFSPEFLSSNRFQAQPFSHQIKGSIPYRQRN